MNKVIRIEYPYEHIVLEFTKDARNESPRPLPFNDWELLQRCERPLYAGSNDGCNAWTDVMTNDGSALLSEMWEYAHQSAEMSLDPDVNDDINVQREVARRVAAAIGCLGFGKEFLLK